MLVFVSSDALMTIIERSKRDQEGKPVFYFLAGSQTCAVQDMLTIFYSTKSTIWLSNCFVMYRSFQENWLKCECSRLKFIINK